ncbi:MAG TPA: serine hydrolase domain-containing protein [Holophagaceae bacterium]|nr:serine hydrolase domain-containing protein [Holophagaceae bacterium]
MTSATSSFYDLASLTKPLVTAPLAHAFLDLDADRRFALGFHDRETPLTARQMLCHGAGLPPWRPFTGEPVAAQLRRPVTGHPLLRDAKAGEAAYSDLGYRMLAELIAAETRIPFAQLGAAMSGLSPAPWHEAPAQMPDGPDAEAWRAAEPTLPLPARGATWPHDLNARAGMVGHAGFGATASQLRNWLQVWSAQWAPRMCIEASREADGSVWGLGLRAAHRGTGRFAELLTRVPPGAGLHVLEDAGTGLAEAVPPLVSEPGQASAWRCHFGFTGPALFFRPEDGACLGLLLHRRGPDGGLLDAEALRTRRWKLLDAITAKLGA